MTVPLTLAQAMTRIDSIFNRYRAATSPASIVSNATVKGKVYEAWILSLVLENFERLENCRVTLIGGSLLKLRSSPGPIKAGFSHFTLSRYGMSDLEVWTDIEFRTMSHHISASSLPPAACYKHELDIVVVSAGTRGYPAHDEIHMAVECKHTAFEKRMVREALGVRRELSLLQASTPTTFSAWPSTAVPAEPPSVCHVYSSDPAVASYGPAGRQYGIEFVHEPL